MACIDKLVIFASDSELAKHAAGYPCLVNFNPFTNTGNIDDGCGHYANVTFIAIDPAGPEVTLPPGPFDNVEFVGFPMPAVFQQH